MKISQILHKRIIIFAHLILFACALVSAVEAQTSGVDLSFNAVASKESAGFGNFVLQPDGKVLLLGGAPIINGAGRGNLSRLNADGSLDTSFNCAACNFNIGSAVVQPDGKIIVAGSVTAQNLFNSFGASVRRLNPDGSLDATFVSGIAPPANNTSSGSTVWAIGPNGEVIVSTVTSGNNFVSYTIFRLNANGEIITTIPFSLGRTIYSYINKIVVQPDGKILVGSSSSGLTSLGSIVRFNTDGTRDTTFEVPTLGSPNGQFGSTFVNNLDIQPDGKIVFVGLFTAVNAVSRVNIARLMPTGNVDLSFVPPNPFTPSEALNQVKVLPNGQILASAGNPISNGQPPTGGGNRFFRFNSDGSIDNTFVVPGNLTQIGKWDVDSSGRVVLNGGFLENGSIVYRYVRLNSNGSLDNSFNVEVRISGSISLLEVQTDGKIIVFGDFTRLNDVPRKNFARLNADGSVDAAFNPGTGFSGGDVTKILVLPDGKILVAGSFDRYNGTQRTKLVRLNADGSLDESFNPTINNVVYTAALQADGKILIGGGFNIVNGVTRTALARLNADGSLDASFNPVFGSSSIQSILVQPAGKIMVGGSFNGVNGFNRVNLVRLNADGTLDSSFNAGNIPGTVRQIELQANGKYFVLTNTIVRLNNDGTTDASFQTPTFTTGSGDPFSVNISQFMLQPDGSIIVVGNFLTANNVSRLRIARFGANGNLDLINFKTGANNVISTIARQSDGKIIVGGAFTFIESVIRGSIARLNVNSSRLNTPFDFDGDGRADVSVFRPSNGFWYELRGVNNSFFAMQFGQSGDRIAPADYDGDGKTDIAVFRDVVPGAGISAYFYITRSSDNSFVPVQFGATGDVPVSGDWDGDGRGDLAVYRDGSLTGGQSYFYYRPSSQPSVNFNTIPLGVTGDKPLVGDFDGDGRIDPAVFRPSTVTWIILRTSVNQITQTAFGLSTDIPAPADFDGDGATNIAVFRPSNSTWYRSTNPLNNYGAVQFGASGDLPVAADYDGDGRADVAVFRPSNGVWYIMRSTEGLTGVQFGISEDRPIPNAYIY